MNLKLINLFEKEFGTTLSTINKEKFLNIFYSKKLSDKYFTSKNNVFDILEYLKSNDNLKNFVDNLLLKFEIQSCENFIDDLFTKYIEDNIRESLINSVKYNISEKKGIYCVSIALCTMIALEDQDISVYYNNVSNSLNEIFSRISTLELDRSTYSTYCDVLDLIIQTQFYWNSRYENKIDVSGIDECLIELHNFEYEVLENSKVPSLDIEPETLELLDITKLGRI